MPVRKYKRKTYKKRYTTGRTFKRSRIPRKLGFGKMKLYHFKRVVSSGIISTVANTNYFNQYSYNLQQLPNYTEFSALYHNMRINKLVVRFVPTFTANEMVNPTTGTTPNWNMPNISTIIDFNDASMPASEDVFLQSSTLRITRGNKIHTRIFTPALLGVNYEGVGSNSYTPKFKQWLSTQNSGDLATPHYGLKIYIPNMGTTMYMSFRIYTTFYFSCKDLR